MLRFENRTAVVTGATAGIGLGIARQLAAQGARVYITGRRPEKIDEALELIGPNAVGVQADSSNPADVDRLYARVAADGRALDIVVANAGGGEIAPLTDITPDHIDRVLRPNVHGTVFTVQKALPLLSDDASVILIGSIASGQGAIGLSMYAASKAAIRSFARTWANELKDRGIRVNVVSPGIIKTPAYTGGADPADSKEMFDNMAELIPIGRVGEPSDIAATVLFLAGPDSTFVTGADYHVDGGAAQI